MSESRRGMPKDIVETIYEQKLQRTQRSVRGSEAFEKTVHNNTQLVKRQLDGGEESTDLDVRTVTAQQMAALYYGMVAEYNHKSCFTDFSKINKKAIAFWARVVDACKETSMTPNEYMKAQFVWFHKTFKTTPTPIQLSTKAAIERAREFTGTRQKRVVASAKDANVEIADVFRRCEKQVRDMCRAQKMTREQFYAELVLTGEFSLPLSFLEADPVYRRVTGG
jgi:hypothetical protein